MLQPFSSEIFWFQKLSFSWNRVSWLCQSACGECFLCWVISGLPGDENIKAQPFKSSWSFEDIRGRYIVGQIWSWWFPDFLLKKIGGTSFCLILGTRPQPACLVAASKPFVLFLPPSHEPTTFFPAYLHSLYRETCTKLPSLPEDLQYCNENNLKDPETLSMTLKASQRIWKMSFK